MSTNGKGSKRRPGDLNKYREGWERIFGSAKKKGKKNGKGQ